MKWYKEYPIIQVDNGAVLVDKKDKSEGYWYQNNSEKTNSQIVEVSTKLLSIAKSNNGSYTKYKIIAHSGIRFLKNSKLPLFEIPNKAEAAWCKHLIDAEYGKSTDEWLLERRHEGFIEGYKASEGYTKEDLIKHLYWVAEMVSGKKNSGKSDSEIRIELDNYIKSLKKYPTSALVELRNSWKKETLLLMESVGDNPKDFIFIPTPQVDKNNYIIIKEFYYS